MHTGVLLPGAEDALVHESLAPPDNPPGRPRIPDEGLLDALGKRERRSSPTWSAVLWPCKAGRWLLSCNIVIQRICSEIESLVLMLGQD